MHMQTHFNNIGVNIQFCHIDMRNVSVAVAHFVRFFIISLARFCLFERLVFLCRFLTRQFVSTKQITASGESDCTFLYWVMRACTMNACYKTKDK